MKVKKIDKYYGDVTQFYHHPDESLYYTDSVTYYRDKSASEELVNVWSYVWLDYFPESEAVKVFNILRKPISDPNIDKKSALEEALVCARKIAEQYSPKKKGVKCITCGSDRCIVVDKSRSYTIGLGPGPATRAYECCRCHKSFFDWEIKQARKKARN